VGDKSTVFLNTTVKSGTSLIETALAPTWPMVLGHKNKTVSDARYLELYKAKLDSMPNDSVSQLTEMANKKGINVVVSCYCGESGFCHRFFLIDYLCERFGFKRGYEIKKLYAD